MFIDPMMSWFNMEYFKKICFCFVFLSGSLCVYICALCLYLVPKEARRECWFPGIGVVDGCETPCGCWELNPRLWKNNKCSKPLNCLSVSKDLLFNPLFIIIIIELLGIEPRCSCILDQILPLWAISPDLFVFILRESLSKLYRLALDLLPIVQ